MKKIRVAGLVNDSVVDGPGIRYTIFFQGCYHNCYRCHNPDTHDMEGGYEIEISAILTTIKNNPLLDGVTFSGGEPFLQPQAFAILANEIKKIGLNLIVYTGFLYEELAANSKYKKLLSYVDILIDGKFIYEERSLELRFHGSKNQRVIDVQKSIQNNQIIYNDL